MQSATLINGFVLGWSVAWPPGPVNAEMLRRSVIPRSQGGGFWAAWQLGLGACTGDFLWALAVMTGAGALLNTHAFGRSSQSSVSFCFFSWPACSPSAPGDRRVPFETSLRSRTAFPRMENE